MVNETNNTPIKWIQKLQQYRSKDKQDELAKILDYGEKIKAEGERKKQEFWEIRDREDFLKLLRYKWKHENELLGKYQYWESMKGLEREKFIAEYLHDDMLYSIDIQKCPEGKVGREYYYKDWKNGNVVIEEGVSLDLGRNQIGPEGAKAIAKYLKLKEGVKLYLYRNEIGDDGAEAIANNLELKEGVYLDLRYNQIGNTGAEAIAKYLKLKEGVKLYLPNNQIGDDGAEAIANNLELKEGVFLDLYNNQIGDDGAEVIMKNMELKNGVTLYLWGNNISEDVRQRLKDWEKSYHDKGINCEVLV